MKSLRVLITGGPTRAYLDRVRFLSNFSTGALAHELGKQLSRRKIQVSAIIGPTALDFESLKLTKLKRVETNEEMRAAVMSECRKFRPHFVVFSAAVLDFVPVKRLEGKVSSKDAWTVKLKPSPKIIDEVGKKFPDIGRIGFKLEWKSAGKAQAFGEEILRRKKLDGLVLNYLSNIKGASHPALCFAHDGKITKARDKKEIAAWIVKYVS